MFKSKHWSMALALASLSGCMVEDEPEEIAGSAYGVHLETSRTFCGDESGVLASVTVPIAPEQGETLYLFAKTTALRSYTGAHEQNLIDAVKIVCPGSSVQTTQNHRGTDSVDQSAPGLVLYASLLYHPTPGQTEVTCTLQGRGGGNAARGCMVYQAGASNTWLHPYLERGGWAWGTTLDARNAIDNNGNAVTIIGPGLAPATASYPSGETTDLGASEYVLKGRRFSADPSATSLDVVDDLELTCESDEGSCNVTAKLLVQRMKSPTSSTVCRTTEVSQTKTLNTQSHHQKLYVNASAVPFSVTCTDGTLPVGRSYIIKSQVTLNNADDNLDYVVVERGGHADPALTYQSGYSITNVMQNF